MKTETPIVLQNLANNERFFAGGMLHVTIVDGGLTGWIGGVICGGCGVSLILILLHARCVLRVDTCLDKQYRIGNFSARCG